MPGENLSRAEAASRAAALSNVEYSVELDLSEVRTSPTFLSTTRISFDSTVDETWLDLIADEVVSVVVNGSSVPVEFKDSRLYLSGLTERNDVLVLAVCRYMRTGEGLHRFVDPVDDETYLYTQFEVADARRMYACFDQPDLKAPWALRVMAPAHWEVISNSPTPAPEEGPTADVSVWTFEPTPRMSTYITALVAGPYHRVDDEYSGPNGTYPLSVFCRRSSAPSLDADEILTVTKQGFEFFEDKFGLAYPFAKYDQIFVPEFNAGAMENAGCVTITEHYLFRSRVTDAAYEQRANTILHELSHMWFGDLVTMTWWDDLWLNESFAEWAAHYANVHATRYTNAWTTFGNLRKAWAYRQDQLPSTHPIAADMVDLDAVRVNFDGITYAKGAAALRQLVAWVGEGNFLAGVHHYFKSHAWGNTTLQDLLDALHQTSGRDLSAWVQQWLQTSGVNTLRPLVATTDGVYDSVAIEQSPPTQPPGIEPILRDHRIAVGLYDLTEGRLALRESFEIDVAGSTTDVPQLRGVRQPDLLLLNDGDLTFAKVRLDERSERTAIEHMASLNDPLARSIVWGAAWDMLRDAELPTGEYLQMALNALPHETEISVVQQTLRQIGTALTFYADPSKAEGYERSLADELWRLTTEAETGSDFQLAFLRAFASYALSDDHIAHVAALLDGDAEHAGLAVDTDLRWLLLDRLVTLGRRGDEAIQAELARDDTSHGRERAQELRAGRPTAEAKAEAWEQSLNDTDLPNAMLEATITGIMVPEHRQLLEAHVEQYYAALPEVWRTRTPETAQTITEGLFPSLLVSQETVDRATRALVELNLPTAGRRILHEGHDAVQRALRCRAADAR